jgi:hypothetical protein
MTTRLLTDHSALSTQLAVSATAPLPASDPADLIAADALF